MNDEVPEEVRPGLIRSVTEAMYWKQCKAMRTRCLRDGASKDPKKKFTLGDLITHLHERRDLCLRTKATYRCAILWLIFKSDLSEESKQEYIRKLERLKLPPETRRTRARKAHLQVISTEELALLEGLLTDRAKKAKWARRLLAWVRAGLITGLRPVEWCTAEWDDEHKLLRCETAKLKADEPAYTRGQRRDADAQRANTAGLDIIPETREIPILDPLDQRAVAIHLAEFRQLVPKSMRLIDRDEIFDKYYNQCAKALTRACKKLWNKPKYSLMTLRGQFSANAKSQYGVVATAALMGHSRFDSPSATSYGKSWQAHARFKGLRPADSLNPARKAPELNTYRPRGG